MTHRTTRLWTTDTRPLYALRRLAPSVATRPGKLGGQVRGSLLSTILSQQASHCIAPELIRSTPFGPTLRQSSNPALCGRGIERLGRQFRNIAERLRDCMLRRRSRRLAPQRCIAASGWKSRLHLPILN